MSDIDYARLLSKKAHGDLKALAGMLDTDTFEDDIFGFHAQQAVEKGLKSLLCLHDIVFRKVHDLEELVNLLESKNVFLPEQFSILTNLSDFAVQFRYESYEELNAGLNRKDIIIRISEFLEYIDQRIQTKPSM
jgi:HEPN domain-containing protein